MLKKNGIKFDEYITNGSRHSMILVKDALNDYDTFIGVGGDGLLHEMAQVLINKKDKILVACSGGKDSTTVLYILNKLGYKPGAITIDATIGNYTKQNLKNIKNFCKNQGIKLYIISFRKEFGSSLCHIKSLLKSKGYNYSSCTICGVLRRYLLNKYARKLKTTKIVTGHNLNDEAQSIVMNLFKNNLEILSKLGPKTGIMENKKFVPRIKPLYLIPEKEIEQYSKTMKFPVNYTPCPCREGVFRCTIDKLLSNYEKKVPGTHRRIIKWFLSISPLLKQQFKTNKKQRYCNNCREPSKDQLCAACQILEKIK